MRRRQSKMQTANRSLEGKIKTGGFSKGTAGCGNLGVTPRQTLTIPRNGKPAAQKLR
jgi:hypothetical protein